MLAFFRVIVERVKALLLADAALDLEAHVAARAAERKAELLRRAAGYEAEGLTTLAAELRQRAEALDLSRPPAGIHAPAEPTSSEANGNHVLSNTSAPGVVGRSDTASLPAPPVEPVPSRRTARKSG
jgi:hypothetical protein